MEPKEYADVLSDLMGKKRTDMPFAATTPQKAIVSILFREFADLADVETEFAIKGDAAKWFRKQCIKILCGRESMNELTSGEMSVLIDEFGVKTGGMWQLSAEGKRGLFMLADIVAESNPTQQALL